MRIARRINQIIFFLIYFVLFLATSYPLNHQWPVHFFLKMDTLAVFSAVIATRTLAALSVASILMLILSLVAGRFFCGWVCPLGACVDFSDRVLRSKRQKSNNRNIKFSSLKFILLILIFVASLFALQMGGYFAPIPLLTRTMTTFIYPIFVFLMEKLISLFYAFDTLENIAFNFDTTLRGGLLPVSHATFYGSLFFGSMFIGLLSLGLFQRRAWCRNGCPLGALLGFTAKGRIYQRIVSEDCTQCGLCARECRMGAIPLDYSKTRYSECINCMDCQYKCPVNAISFQFQKKFVPQEVDLTRRQVMGSVLTGFFTMTAIQLTLRHRTQKKSLIRPPGALKEFDFLNTLR